MMQDLASALFFVARSLFSRSPFLSLKATVQDMWSLRRFSVNLCTSAINVSYVSWRAECVVCSWKANRCGVLYFPLSAGAGYRPFDPIVLKWPRSYLSSLLPSPCPPEVCTMGHYNQRQPPPPPPPDSHKQSPPTHPIRSCQRHAVDSSCSVYWFSTTTHHHQIVPRESRRVAQDGERVPRGLSAGQGGGQGWRRGGLPFRHGQRAPAAAFCPGDGAAARRVPGDVRRREGLGGGGGVPQRGYRPGVFGLFRLCEGGRVVVCCAFRFRDPAAASAAHAADGRHPPIVVPFLPS